MSLRKYLPRTGTYITLGPEHGTTIEERIISGSTVTVVSFQFKDGGPLDDDGVQEVSLVHQIDSKWNPIYDSILAIYNKLLSLGMIVEAG